MTNSNNSAKKLYKVFVQKHNADEIKSSATKLNISIDEAAHRVDVFMDVNRKTLKGAYKVFVKAVEQAVADGALDKKVAEFAYFADDINDIDFADKDYFIANDNLNNSFAYGIDDNGDNGYYFWFWTLTEAAEEIADAVEVSEEIAEINAVDDESAFALLPALDELNDVDIDDDDNTPPADEPAAEETAEILRDAAIDVAYQKACERVNVTIHKNGLLHWLANPGNDDWTTNKSIADKILAECGLTDWQFVIKTQAEYFVVSEQATTISEICKMIDAERVPTRSQLQNMIDGVIAEREEYFDALEEYEADDECPQRHIDYLKDMIEELGNEYWDLVKQYDNAPDDEPPADEPAEDDISDICKRTTEDDDKPCRLDWDDSATFIDERTGEEELAEFNALPVIPAGTLEPVIIDNGKTYTEAEYFAKTATDKIAAAKSTLTRSQLQKMIDGVIAEREEYFDALDEALADEEVPQRHIDYLNDMLEKLSNEYWELVKLYDNAPAEEIAG